VYRGVSARAGNAATASGLGFGRTSTALEIRVVDCGRPGRFPIRSRSASRSLWRLHRLGREVGRRGSFTKEVWAAAPTGMSIHVPSAKEEEDGVKWG
jgi:hypothetical protein